MTEKPFLYVSADEGDFFINLLQVVRTSNLASDEIVLYMSNGTELKFHGGLVTVLFLRIGELAVTHDGSSCATVIKAAMSESSSALPTEVPQSGE